MIFSLKNKDNNYQFSPKLQLYNYDLECENGIIAYEITMNLKAFDCSELSFKIPKYYNSVVLGRYLNPVYEKLSYHKYVHVNDVGYFIVDNTVEYTDGIEEYKSVTCYSAEYMFQKKYLDTFIINMGTVGSIDKVKFYNRGEPNKSLLNIILEKFPMWTIVFSNLETSDGAKSLASSKRSFDIDRKSVYDFINDDIYNSFEAIIMFDIENLIIYPYPIKTFSNEIDFKISLSTLAKDVTLNYNESNITTSLSCSGGNGMDFRAVNCGYNNIENVSFFKEYFKKQGLDLDKYQKFREEKNEEYFEKYLEAQKTYNKLFDLKYYEPTAAIINMCTKYNGKYNSLPEDSEFYGRITYYSDSKKSIYTDIELMSKDIESIKTTLSQHLGTEAVDKLLKDVTAEDSLIGYNMAKTLYKQNVNTLSMFNQIYDSDNKHLADQTNNIILNKIYENWGLKKIYNNLKEKVEKYEEIYNGLKNELSEISAAGSLMTWLEKKHPPSFANNSEIIEKLNNLYQSFIIENELVDDSFIITDSMWRKDLENKDIEPYSDNCSAAEMMRSFKKRCEYELQVVSHPQISFEANIINLFSLPRYKNLWKDWELGNYFYTQVNTYDEEKVRLQEIHFDFDNPDNFSCTFSNQIRYSDNIDNKGSKFKKLFGNLTSFAKQKVATDDITTIKRED